jgi:hypothetical protein
MAVEGRVLRVVMHDASAFQGEEETVRELLEAWPHVSGPPRAVQAIPDGGTRMLRAINPDYVAVVTEVRVGAP